MRLDSVMRPVLASLLLSAASMANAADGDLDTSFGTLGLGSTRFLAATPVPRDTVVLPDGKILVAAEIQQTSGGEVDSAVIRFNADGSIDDSFSFDGNVLTNFGGSTVQVQDQLRAMLVQPDGKIVLCGGTGEPNNSDAQDFGVVRLNSDGSLDTSFGSGTGKVRIAFDLGINATDDVCFAAAQQTDGKLVFVGRAKVDLTHNYDFAVARLTSTGALDTTFNSTGKQTVAFDLSGSNFDDEAFTVAIDRDGGILVGGYADHGSSGTARADMAVARLLTNGQLDDNFNTDGKATITFSRNGGTDASVVEKLLIQPDGKLVLGGYASQDVAQTYFAFAVTRLFPDGSTDAAFGPNGNGRVRVKFDVITDSIDAAFGGLLQSDGKIVLAGLAETAASPQAAAVAFARLTAGGIVDTTFGNSGKAYDTLPLGSETMVELAVGPKLQNGRIVAAVGQFDHTGGSYVGVVRLQDDLIFSGGFQ